jgi:DNA-binding XRE family transcriptional regulator
MPRAAYPSPSLSALVRAHFGLTQADLARFIGVSRQMVTSVEAGSKDFAEATNHRLWVLARYLPPPAGLGPPAPEFVPTEPDPAEALDPGPIEDRLQRCRFYLAKARHELSLQQKPAQYYARRRWAVSVLRPMLTTLPDAATALRWPGATPDPTTDLPWLDNLAADTAAVTPPLAPTERALRRARMRALEVEIAELEAALGDVES